MKHVVCAALVAGGVVAFAHVSRAQEVNACTILASRLPQDVLIQGSDLQVFKKYQSLIASEQFRDFATASSQKLDLGINVVEYVSGTLGTKSDSSTWDKDWQKFVSMQDSDFQLSSTARTELRTTNERVIRDIVSCNNSNAFGLHNALSVTGDRNSFVISATYRTDGPSDWSINEITLSPADAGATCQNVSPLPKQIHQAAITIACSKDPARAVQVSINTSQGPIGPYEIRGIRSDIEVLQQQIDDLTRTMNAAVDEQKRQTDARLTSLADHNPFTNRNCNDIRGGFTWNEWLVCPEGQYMAGAQRYKTEQQITFIRCCPRS